MSTHIGVFVPANRVPTPEAWTDAASRSGFDFRIEGGVDVHGHDGTLPVTCDGVHAGFEYYLCPIGEFLADGGADLAWLVKLRLRWYFHAAVFVTHSRFDDRFAAVVASASFALASRGLLLDDQTGELVRHARVMEWARRGAHPPSAEALARRRRTRAVVHDFVGEILDRLGYRILQPSPLDHDQPESRWFARAGSTFANELVEAQVNADAAESSLVISFYGSRHPLERLQAQGTMDLAHQIYYSRCFGDDAYKRPDPPLPHSIPVDEGFPRSSTGKRLASELRRADERAFRELRALLSEETTSS